MITYNGSNFLEVIQFCGDSRVVTNIRAEQTVMNWPILAIGCIAYKSVGLCIGDKAIKAGVLFYKEKGKVKACSEQDYQTIEGHVWSDGELTLSSTSTDSICLSHEESGDFITFNRSDYEAMGLFFNRAQS